MRGLSIACAVLVSGFAVACGLDAAGTGGGDAGMDATFDASVDGASRDANGNDANSDATNSDATSSDSGGDASVVDAAPDAFDPAACVAGGGFVCGLTCVGSCQTCAGATAACNATRTCSHDCSDCIGSPFPCYDCRGQPRGVCYQVKCDMAGITNCPCVDGDAGSCPGATQICSGGGNPVCLTCGTGGTDHKQCENGLSCKESTGTCM
jgi:hypothetical protein